MRFSELLNQDGKIDWTHVCHLIHLMGTHLQDGEYQIAKLFTDELRDNDGIMNLAIKFHRSNMQYCTPRLLDSETFLQNLLSIQIDFQYVSERLQNKKSFVEGIILGDYRTIYELRNTHNIPDWCYKGSDTVMKALKVNYSFIQYVDESLINSTDFIKELIKTHPRAYYLLPAHVKYLEENFIEALNKPETSIYAIGYQGEWTEEMIDALIKNHPGDCFNVDAIMSNPSRVLKVLKRASWLVKSLPQATKNTINHYKRVKGITDSVEAYEYAITIKEMRTQKREITATIGSKGRAKKSEPAQTVSNTVRRL